MWFKVIVACIPAVIVGLKWDDAIEEHFYNYKVVAIMLILIGVLFIMLRTAISILNLLLIRWMN